MFCDKCGKRQDRDGAVYCHNCGAPLTGSFSSQSVSHSFDVGTRYAGFWVRFVAYLIDAVVFGIAFAIVGGIVGASGSSAAGALLFLLEIVGGWLYFAKMESGPTQGTLGKMALGLRVVDENGDRLSFGRATGRYFGKVVSSIILCIGYIMIGFDSRKQGLHDKLANTFVVHGR